MLYKIFSLINHNPKTSMRSGKIISRNFVWIRQIKTNFILYFVEIYRKYLQKFLKGILRNGGREKISPRFLKKFYKVGFVHCPR